MTPGPDAPPGPRCPACGYPLADIAPAPCPECGWAGRPGDFGERVMAQLVAGAGLVLIGVLAMPVAALLWPGLPLAFGVYAGGWYLLAAQPRVQLSARAVEHGSALRAASVAAWVLLTAAVALTAAGWFLGWTPARDPLVNEFISVLTWGAAVVLVVAHHALSMARLAWVLRRLGHLRLARRAQLVWIGGLALFTLTLAFSRAQGIVRVPSPFGFLLIPFLGLALLAWYAALVAVVWRARVVLQAYGHNPASPRR